MEPSNTSDLKTSGPARPGPVRRNDRALRHTRRWLPYAGLLLLIALITAGLWPRPTPVETGLATIGALQSTVNEEGKTRIKQRYLVCAPAAGHLQRIDLKPGAEVHARQTIVAVLEPAPPFLLDPRARALSEARRESAGAQLRRATADLRFAATELERVQKLHSQTTVSIQELESAQWRETAAAAQQIAAASALRETEAELADLAQLTNGSVSRYELTAPSGGRVLRVFEESARTVAAGTPLLEIGDPADLEVVIEVLSRDGATIQPGTKVILEHWGGAEPLQASVRLVEPAAFTKISALGVEEQRVNVIADFINPPEKRRALGDNFRVETRIVLWETNSALKVPSGALFRRGKDWAAFVLRDNRTELRTVQAGPGNGLETQVLSGLDPGESVILYPGDRIRDGLRVRPMEIR